MVKALDTKVGNSTRKLVLLKLADQSNDDGICWPSHATIAKAVECSKPTVIRHLNELVKAGYLSIEKRKRENGSQTSNVYKLLIDTPQLNSDTPPVKICDPQNLPLEPKEKDTKVSKKESLPERQNTFEQDVFNVGCGIYTTQMLDAFIDYWTEHDKVGNMLFEKQKTWETKRRLARWNKNNFNNAKQQIVELDLSGPEWDTV